MGKQVFFSEEKKQKTFIPASAPPHSRRAVIKARVALIHGE
jgi:hypothetical protein